jgi:hypothetical protein
MAMDDQANGKDKNRLRLVHLLFAVAGSTPCISSPTDPTAMTIVDEELGLPSQGIV